MRKSVEITLVATIVALLFEPIAIQGAISTEFDSVPFPFHGIVGEWADVYTAEFTNEGWRDYEMDFVKRVEHVSDSQIRIHRVNGPPPLEVVFSPSQMTVSWPNGDGNTVLVTESKIERFDLQGPTDWSCLIRTDWHGQEVWMEMILTGDMFTYTRWQKTPTGDRRYTRIHFMKRIS